MTNWRERGYVPPSDGEESDSDLSTQEPIPPHYNGNLAVSCSTQQITRDAVQSATPGRDDRANPSAVQSSQITARERIQTLDLSNVPDGKDEVEEVDLDSENGGVAIQASNHSI